MDLSLEVNNNQEKWSMVTVYNACKLNVKTTSVVICSSKVHSMLNGNNAAAVTWPLSLIASSELLCLRLQDVPNLVLCYRNFLSQYFCVHRFLLLSGHTHSYTNQRVRIGGSMEGEEVVGSFWRLLLFGKLALQCNVSTCSLVGSVPSTWYYKSTHTGRRPIYVFPLY